MRKRTMLEMSLGGIFGAVLGGIVTISLLFSGVGHWLVLLPMMFGGIAGFWKGDRALYRMMRLVPWLSR